jgi:hypothetical protein
MNEINFSNMPSNAVHIERIDHPNISGVAIKGFINNEYTDISLAYLITSQIKGENKVTYDNIDNYTNLAPTVHGQTGFYVPNAK